MMTSTLIRQKLAIKQKLAIRRHYQHAVILAFCGITVVLFVVYTTLIVANASSLMWRMDVAQRFRRGVEPEEPMDAKAYDDEVVKLLGGPDQTEAVHQKAFDSAWITLSKSQLSHNYPAIEKNLLRLLRVKRNVPNLNYTPVDSARSSMDLMDAPHDPTKPTYPETTSEVDQMALEIQAIHERNRHSDNRCNNATINGSMAMTTTESLFPEDLFTMEQRRHGAVLLHFCGLIYMFVALAVVCDEYFVPALGVITEALKISDDVAGATFMAAGGSAPEFFTSVFGVFITQNNVGIGTIVGSATFNILCVLAFCTLFSKTILQLTWWPLFRDISFYIVSLFFLVMFFVDEKIVWYEALVLLLIYISYGIFMKFNGIIEDIVKVKLFKKKILNQIEPALQIEHPETPHSAHHLKKHIPVLHSGAGIVRDGIVELVLNPSHIDNEGLKTMSLPATPRLTEEDLQDPGIPLRKLGIYHVPINAGKTIKVRPAPKNKLSKTCSYPVFNIAPKKPNFNGIKIDITKPRSSSNRDRHVINGLAPIERPRTPRFAKNELDFDRHKLSVTPEVPENDSDSTALYHVPKLNGLQTPTPLPSMYPEDLKQNDDEDDDDEKPIDLSWPDTWTKRFWYLFLAPIMFPLYFTLPDVKKPNMKRFVIVTFVGSVLWIAFFSYLMVWWANTIGLTLGIPTEVMGLTILAAGTSIPDLITSVIVARKGLGDMAVSSSIGSNVFDVCIGLPIPWLLYFLVSFIQTGESPSPISVSSNGLICSVGLLFSMILLLIVSIAACGWKMNKWFGVVMMIAYIMFCVFSIFLELNMISCPLRILGVTC